MGNLAELLKKEQDKISREKVTIGFDGYIDELISVVRNRIDPDNFQPFTSIGEFAGALQQSKGSCGFEITTIDKRMGGNGPILANALANMGVQTTCVGTFGKPVDELFLQSKVNEWISIGEVAHTLAFEFQDGKLMLGNQDGLNRVTWDSLLQNAGMEQLISCFSGSRIIGITNWSQMAGSNDLWRGILENCMPRLDPSVRRFLFFDLADPSIRSTQELYDGLKLIEAFRKYGTTVLGLNKMEANLVCRCLYGGQSQDTSFELTGRKITDKLNVDILVLHSSERVSVFANGRSAAADCVRVADPKVLTGCGDNFNAGFCLGLLLELPVDTCIKLGSYTAAYYIANAVSPGYEDLIRYIG